MSSLKKIFGSMLAITGFLLSPLSWWNDLFVNIPLAYLLTTVISLVVPGHFAMFMVLNYWLTNVLGLILMHKGGTLVLDQGPSSYNVRSVIKDLKISLLYSLAIASLIMTGVLRLPTEYFR